MMPRLLHLFVCAAALVTVAYPARAVPEKIQYSGDAKPGTIVGSESRGDIDRKSLPVAPTRPP